MTTTHVRGQEQMTVQRADVLAGNLPGPGWSVSQKLRAVHTDRGGIETVLGPVLVIGPGDRVVGEWVGGVSVVVHDTTTYWHVLELVRAGWIVEGVRGKDD